MVGIMSIILIISLGSYLVAFVNACIDDNAQGCVKDGNATYKCCDDTSLCFSVYDGPAACIAVCVDDKLARPRKGEGYILLL